MRPAHRGGAHHSYFTPRAVSRRQFPFAVNRRTDPPMARAKDSTIDMPNPTSRAPVARARGVTARNGRTRGRECQAGMPTSSATRTIIDEAWAPVALPSLRGSSGGGYGLVPAPEDKRTTTCVPAVRDTSVGSGGSWRSDAGRRRRGIHTSELPRMPSDHVRVDRGVQYQRDVTSTRSHEVIAEAAHEKRTSTASLVVTVGR